MARASKTPTTGAPATSSGNAPVQSALNRRATRPTTRKSEPSRQANDSGMLKLYTDDDTRGIQVGPSGVLIISLSYIAIVVILHIVGKIRG